MSIKKYSSGSWVSVPYRKYETTTDTFTSLPQTIIGDGQPISSYTIKGNMSQSGTPTPSNPVYPQETGDKTANLFDYADTWNGTYQDVTYTPIDKSSFRINGQATGGKQITKALDMTGTYRLTITIEGTENDSASHSVNAYVDGSRYILTFSKTITTSTITFTGHLTAIDTIINNTFDGNIVIKLMLTEGTSQVDYEPYGYKIPISLNNVTYPIYISEPLRKSLDGSNLYDTIESNGTLTRRVDANGDALATPTTEQVTVPTLTTTGTAEQFNVLTTLAPSEVSLTYHGWHEHSDTKFTTP